MQPLAMTTPLLAMAHLSSGSNLGINIRFTFFATRVACVIGFVVTIASSV